MSVVKQIRQSDSPLIQRVTFRQYLGGEGDVALPDGTRDALIIKQDNKLQVIFTGNITHPIPLNFSPGTEVTNIVLAPGALYTPSELAGPRMFNKSLYLPTTSKDKVWVGTDTLEIPTFENAEGFIDTLLKKGLLYMDQFVTRLVEGSPVASSQRTQQRRFVEATGLTYKQFTQLERARKAFSLLQMGQPALDVAFSLDYTDQAHMINSLRRILGQTPSKINSVK